MSVTLRDEFRRLKARLVAAKMAIEASPEGAKHAVAALQARAALSIIADIQKQGGLEDEAAASITSLASDVPWGGEHPPHRHRRGSADGIRSHTAQTCEGRRPS